MNRRVLSQRMHRSVFATLLACSLLTPAFANSDHKREAARGNAVVDIDNFGQVNDHIYRGGQPKGDNYHQLATLGVKTIVDLRGDSEPDERALSERAGLRYINLPMAPKHYPQADAAQRFLEIVNDQANWPVYVHCAGGKHRTGVMLAAYRLSVDGWDMERAYQEMKDYGFYTGMGHGCYKDYIYDYYRDWQAHNQLPGVTNARTAVRAEQRF
jgi:protein tyrosine/serine phosphatase